jgi:hypothetical protein
VLLLFLLYSLLLCLPSFHLPFLLDPFFFLCSATFSYSCPFIPIACLHLILHVLVSLSLLDLFDNHKGTQRIPSRAHHYHKLHSRRIMTGVTFGILAQLYSP